MAQREMDTVLGAKKEVSSSTLSSLKELDTALLKVRESFSLAVKESEGLNAAVGAVGKTAEEMVAESTITDLALAYEKLGATKEELLAINVREFEQQGATVEQAAKYAALLKGIEEKKKEIAEKEAEKTQGIAPAFSEFYRQNIESSALQNKMYEESLKSLGAVQGAVYQGMEDQMISLIETGKFSVGAMGKVIAMQVKMELVGLAAKAAVWAIFETAMGFATWWINPAASSMHFKSAATFGLVAGASLAAAAGVNSLLGNSKNSSSGAVSTSGRSLSAYPAPEKEEPKQIQNITLQIYNPLSQQNWAEIAENNIMPALKAASDMNIVMNVKTVYA